MPLITFVFYRCYNQQKNTAYWDGKNQIFKSRESQSINRLEAAILYTNTNRNDTNLVAPIKRIISLGNDNNNKLELTTGTNTLSLLTIHKQEQEQQKSVSIQLHYHNN